MEKKADFASILISQASHQSLERSHKRNAIQSHSPQERQGCAFHFEINRIRSKNAAITLFYCIKSENSQEFNNLRSKQ